MFKIKMAMKEVETKNKKEKVINWTLEIKQTKRKEHKHKRLVEMVLLVMGFLTYFQI